MARLPQLHGHLVPPAGLWVELWDDLISFRLYHDALGANTSYPVDVLGVTADSVSAHDEEAIPEGDGAFRRGAECYCKWKHSFLGSPTSSAQVE